MLSPNSPSEVYEALIRAGFYPKPRNAISRILENYRGEFLIVQLPTGYGKTSIVYSLALFGIIKPIYHIRTIHVLPLRSIIEDAYSGFLKGIEKIGLSQVKELAAKQMMHTPGSPFLNKLLVFTTFDTFSFHAMKLPPAEASKIVCSKEWLSYGHYEVSRGAILESVVVLDEPQLLLDSRSTRDALGSLLYFLVSAQIPTVLMTATLPSFLREYVTKKCNSLKIPCTSFIYGENIKDQEFEEKEKNRKVETKILSEKKTLEKIAAIVAEKWATSDKILVVLNTVQRAITVYNALLSLGLNPVLLHGRMTVEDKLRVLKILKRDKWIAVSTQVVEAGVNISAQVLVTDAAPANSLVQRTGRVARFEGDDWGEILIIVNSGTLSNARRYHVYSIELTRKTVEVLRKARGIMWRIPRVEGVLGYQDLIDKVYSEERIFPRINQVVQMLDPVSSSRDALFQVYGENFIRESKLVNVFVADEDIDVDYADFYANLIAHSFPSDLKLVEKLAEKYEIKILTYKNGRVRSLNDKSGLRKILTSLFPEVYMMCHGILGVQIDEETYRRVAYGISS